MREGVEEVGVEVGGVMMVMPSPICGRLIVRGIEN